MPIANRAPKDPLENMRYRRELFTACQTSKALRDECWIRASRDIIWWIDVFCWTYSPKEYADDPNRPFITWDYQEGAITKIKNAIGVNDVLIEKSRDMGASWICLAVFTHAWQFRSLQSFLVGSRKQDYVDKSGDPKTLFWKIDYLINMQPAWMIPAINRTAMHIENLSNGSIIDGESTNDDFGRGDRRTAVLLDEFAVVENGTSILSATRDTSKCRIFNSTSEGPGTAYDETRKKMVLTRPERIIRLHWSEHPEKSAGLYTSDEVSPGNCRLRIIDTKYKFPPNYPFVLDGKLRSPWYDEECIRAASKREIARQLDIDHGDAGSSYIEDALVTELERGCRPPSMRGELDFSTNDHAPVFTRQSNGRLQLWVLPDAAGEFHFERDEYVVGVDVATGNAGEMSSSSAISAYDKRTGEKVAQFTSNSTNPDDLAKYAVALCRWLKGPKSFGAFLIWEANGPGGEFTKEIIALKYQNIFYREDETVIQRKKTKKPGWWSGKVEKRLLLAEYAKSLKSKKIVNYCLEAVQECREYEYATQGEIRHRGSLNEDPAASGENHGDMVIADALANRGLNDSFAVEKVVEQEIPVGSWKWRERYRLQKSRRSDTW